MRLTVGNAPKGLVAGLVSEHRIPPTRLIHTTTFVKLVPMAVTALCRDPVVALWIIGVMDPLVSSAFVRGLWVWDQDRHLRLGRTRNARTHEPQTLWGQILLTRQQPRKHLRRRLLLHGLRHDRRRHLLLHWLRHERRRHDML